MMDKLEKIEQIIEDYDTNCGLEEYMYLDMIKDVLTGADREWKNSYFKELKIMGRGIIQHPETKKYAIWSSVVDDFITDWLSEEELKQWQIDDFTEQIKEQEIKVTPFKTFDECLHTIETYHDEDRVNEVKDGITLKPCFCGGTRTIKRNRHSGGMGECYEDWEMRCDKCNGLWTLSADNYYGSKPYSKVEVIKIWNDMVNMKEN